MLPPLPPRLILPPPREPPPMDPPPPRRCATPTPTARLQHKANRNTSFIWCVPLLGSLPPHGRRCKHGNTSQTRDSHHFSGALCRKYGDCTWFAPRDTLSVRRVPPKG